MSDESSALLAALRESLAVIQIAQHETDRRLQIVRKSTEANAEILDILLKPLDTNTEKSSATSQKQGTPTGAERGGAVQTTPANRQRGTAQLLAEPKPGALAGLDAVLAKARAIRGAEKELPSRGVPSRSGSEKLEIESSGAESSDDVEAAPSPPVQMKLPAVQLHANASGLRKSLKRWRSVQSTLPSSWLHSDYSREPFTNATSGGRPSQTASPSSMPVSPMARSPLQNRSPNNETATARAHFLTSMGGMPMNPPARWQGSSSSSSSDSGDNINSSSRSSDCACLAPEAASTLAQGLAVQLAAHVSTDQIHDDAYPVASSNGREDRDCNDEDSDNRRVAALYKAW